MTDRCADCGTRLGDEPFRYRDFAFCCECMSVLCSWLLDGGISEDPEMFAYVNGEFSWFGPGSGSLSWRHVLCGQELEGPLTDADAVTWAQSHVCPER